MSEPTLDDLRVVPKRPGDRFRPVTPAEFDRIATERDYVNFSDLPEELERRGWVKRPVCGNCDGAGEIPMRNDAQGDFREPCPQCGGSGFGRLVALDGIPDVATLSEWMDPLDGLRRSDMTLSEERLCDVVRPLLAALDGGQE